MATTVSNPCGPVAEGSASGQPDEPTITLGGGYVVERMVGASPLGTVVLARGTVSGRPVLVKILADHLADDHEVRARFFRAAELGFRLSHPNVVRVLDAGLDGRPFIVTEYIDGETLADRLDRGGWFSAAETLTLATHLAAGLAHAHASGVVHGSLAPHAILLARDGVARITDFGLGRLLEEAGRPGRVTPADDIYALGTVLRQAEGDDIPPGLAAIVDAALAAHAPARPSAVDVFHQLLTMTGPPAVWLAPADASI